MNIVLKSIPVFAILIIGTIIGFHMINNVIENTVFDEQSEYVKAFLSYVPLIFGIVTCLSILGVLTSGSFVSEDEEEYYLEPEDYEEEPGHRVTIKDAKQILQIRYAKGLISSEEYTERMSRL